MRAFEINGNKNSEASVSLNEENKQLKRLLVEVMNKQSRAEKMGRVFHDFNNMLSSTMGYASLAIERVSQSDDEKLQRYLNNIEKAAIRARDLVKECLEQRQQERHVAEPCTLYESLSRLGVRAEAQSEEVKGSKVTMSQDNLDATLNFLLHGGVVSQSCEGVKASVELASAEYCENCDAELPMGALRVMLDWSSKVSAGSERELTEEEEKLDFAMAAAMINMSGGHMCTSDSNSEGSSLVTSFEDSNKTSGVVYFRTLNLDGQM